MKKLFILAWLLLPAVAGAYPLFSGSLTNIFGTNGTATFTATGSTVAGSSNLLSVALDGTNYIFNSVPTTGAGGQWSLAGALIFDGTNMNCSVQYTSDDVSNRFSTDFVTVTNANPNGTLDITEDDGLINMVLTRGSITAGQTVGTARTPATVDMIPPVTTRIQNGLGTPVYLTVTLDGTVDDTLAVFVNKIPVRDVQTFFDGVTVVDVIAEAAAAGVTLKYGDEITLSVHDVGLIYWQRATWTAEVHWDDGGTNYFTGGTNDTGTGILPLYYDDGSFVLNRPQPVLPSVITNIVMSVTNLPTGSGATITQTGVTNGIAYYVAGIPAGASGTNFVSSAVYSNVVYSSFQLTFTNINPLLCTGSNYIGNFSQLYAFDLNLPNTSAGQSIGTDLVENVWCSTNAGFTNGWFAITNTTTPMIWTNVAVAIVGVNNTNYAGALTLYGVDHPEYIGRTNSFIGQVNQYPNPVNALDAVNLQSMQTAIANATANQFNLVIDTNGYTHYQYAPNGQTNLDLVANKTTWGGFTKFQNSGTNWVLTSTNAPASYQLQYSTNLSLIFGWTTLSGYTTNISGITNTITVPKVLINASYAFFRIVAFQTASATFVPPLTLQNGAIIKSNAWATVFANATNRMSPGDWAVNINSNGVGLWKIWNSNWVFYVQPQ